MVGDKGSSFRHPADAIRAGLVLIPADRLQALLRQRPVRENIALPLVSRISRWGPINLRREKRSVDEWLAAAAEIQKIRRGRIADAVDRADGHPAKFIAQRFLNEYYVGRTSHRENLASRSDADKQLTPGGK